MAVSNIDEAKSLALNWMTDMGYSPKEITPSPANLSFLFQGVGSTQLPFLITQPSGLKVKAIVIIVNVNILESSYKSLSDMSDKVREEFLWNLKRELIFAPANFAFEEDAKTGILRRAQFSKAIYFEELSESKLAEVVDYTTRSALWLIWTFRREFGAPSEVKPNE